MTRGTQWALAGMVVASGSMLAYAAVDGSKSWGVIPYQGMIEQNGVAVAGTVDFCFQLFADNDVNNTTALWAERHADTPVTAGQFSVELGAARAGPTPLNAAVELAQDLWLAVGVAAGGTGGTCSVSAAAGYTALSGRQHLGGVAYALSAKRGVPGQDFVVDGAITVGSTAALCDAATEGAQRYNRTDKTMEFCNGSDWTSMTPRGQIIYVRGSCPPGYTSYASASGRFVFADASGDEATGGNSDHNHVVHNEGRQYEANGTTFVADTPWNNNTSASVNRYGIDQLAFTSGLGGVGYTKLASTMPPYIRLNACKPIGS